MDLDLVSWNGHYINDKESYSTYILPESLFNIAAQPVLVERAERYPQISGKALPPSVFSFQITVVPTNMVTQDDLIEQLKGWFDPQDFQQHHLVAMDKNDDNKLYQLTGYVQSAVPDGSEGTGYVTFLITIATQEPIWSAVTAETDTWNITASGNTHTIETDSNTFVRPTYTITPISPRTGQFAYQRWHAFYNRKTTLPLGNYPVDITDGGISTSALINFTGVSNQINQVGGITAVATTIPIDTPVGGGLPAVGMGYFGTEQIKWTGNSGTQLTGVTRGIGGTTPAVHADNVVIALSKMLADGSDVAVQVDGVLVDRWLNGINTATTKIWIASDWQAGKAGTLLTALPNNGTTVTVAFTKNGTNLQLLQQLKQARNNVFYIGSEAFIYNPANISLTAYTISSCLRAQKTTSFAAHAVGDAVNWIEKDIWLLYGNSSGSPLTVDDSRKPLLDLSASTNTSWSWSNFYDTGSNRPAAWNGLVVTSVGKQSAIYTGDQKALANPATKMGMLLLNYVVAAITKAETASIVWSFYNACGITTVTITGFKYIFSRTVPTWPGVAGLQKSQGGVTWLTVWTEAVPAAANTWTAITHNAQALAGSYTNIRLALIGSVSAAPDNNAALQADTASVVLDNTATPVFALTAETSAYYLNLQILNNTTGKYITVSWPMTIGHSLTVDTDDKTITYDDGTNAIAALVTDTVRDDWLTLESGDNVLQVVDAGIANLRIVTTWNDRKI